MRKKPDPVTRLFSHVIVGLVVGYLVALSSKPVPGLVAGLVAAAAHEEFDAPLAQVLADGGL